MTVYLSDNRERWTYDFWYLGTRHQGYCLDTTGLPVTSRTAAKQAELDMRRLTAVTRREVSVGRDRYRTPLINVAIKKRNGPRHQSGRIGLCPHRALPPPQSLPLLANASDQNIDQAPG